jgi:hypothetical protein
LRMRTSLREPDITLRESYFFAYSSRLLIRLGATDEGVHLYRPMTSTYSKG